MENSKVGVEEQCDKDKQRRHPGKMQEFATVMDKDLKIVRLLANFECV